MGIKKRIKCFGYAWKGLCGLILKETNTRIHTAAAILVVICGFVCDLSASDWCLVVLCIGSVLAAEGFNTAIEKLVDLVSPGYYPLAGKEKDIAAGAVLVTAIAAAVVGLIILYPNSLHVSHEKTSITVILPLCLLLFHLTGCDAPQTSQDMRAGQELFFTAPALTWEETIPLGNGRLGMIPDGGIACETITLNEISLWSGSEFDYSNPRSCPLPAPHPATVSSRKEQRGAGMDVQNLCTVPSRRQ